MKITIISLCLFIICSVSARAQNVYSVKGAVADTASKLKLQNTSVVVLNAKDSTLKAFTRAGADGSFNIGGLSKGKFILLLTYPGYADYVENFSLDSVKREHNFGRLNLFLKSKLLADVIVKGTKAAIKIKGDTTEFNASSYTLQPNAKVEDLLKQLPGIEIDKDGKITAQGQTVNKVLVDGEEFFGDDPTLVTKNIRQDMVDKVQLYDKKSDQATFTGIDDGVKNKTLNIKLKADKKNGSFGKADLGVGTKGFYQEQLLFNVFKGKKKFSAYGTVSNTSKTGLSWEDNQKYTGSSGNVSFGDDGGISIFFGGDDDFESGYFNGQGIPKAISGGAHFDNKWDNDNKTINTNYKFSSLDVTGTVNTQVQNTLPTGTINTNSDKTFSNNNFRQKADGAYTIKFDTTSNLKLTLDGTLKNIDTKSDNMSTGIRGNDILLNRQSTSNTNKGDQKIFNATALYTKKLKKVGRTFSANLSEAINQSNTHGLLNSELDFYNTAGVLDSMQRVNQLKQNNIKSAAFTSNFTYSEPLSKTFAVIFNYGLNYSNSTADRRSYNASGNGRYDNLDLSLSNDYKLNQLINQAGAVFNYKKNKTLLNFGTKVSDVNFNQVDEFTGIKYKRDFTNWMPQATYQYKFSQQASFRFNYNGNTTQPTIDQIQPIRVNTDPLNITIGNPDLKPSFRNSFSVNYNSYKVLSNQSIYLYGSYSFTSNAIVNNTVTDSAGKSTFQAINLNGKQPSNFYSNVGINRNIWGVSVGLNAGANGNTSYSYINNVLSESKSINYNVRLSLSKYKEKKYSIYGAIYPSYTVSKTSLQSQINNNGRGLNSDVYFNLFLPGKVEIGSDLTYTYRAATQSFNEDYRRTLLNVVVRKSFLKSESLKLAVTANDLLNQNTGFSRNAYGNQITQTTYTTIKRYFMFSITYDFNHMGGGAPKK